MLLTDVDYLLKRWLILFLAKHEVEHQSTSLHHWAHEEPLSQYRCIPAGNLAEIESLDFSLTLCDDVMLCEIPQEDSVCFMRAFVAPLSWEALTTPEENITDMDDYEKLMLATKPALQDISLGRMRLPKHLALLKVTRMWVDNCSNTVSTLVGF